MELLVRLGLRKSIFIPIHATNCIFDFVKIWEDWEETQPVFCL